jgi:hypothetical protein
MASAADGRFQTESKSSFAGIIDRWIYVFMAALFVVTTLVGFIPDSLFKIGLVETGKRPPFPFILHVHAVLMGSWLMLLLAQTTLMATSNSAHHQKLGMLSFLLAPLIILSGFVLVPTMYGQVWAAVQSPPPGLETEVTARLTHVTNIMLIQFRAGVLFTLFVFLGLRARRTDSGFHKRMIILATVIPMPASIDRIQWLPATLPESALSPDLYTLLWISPMFFWDLFRLRRVHRAYIVWLAFWLPAAILLQILWGSDWWQSTAPGIMGFS